MSLRDDMRRIIGSKSEGVLEAFSTVKANTVNMGTIERFREAADQVRQTAIRANHYSGGVPARAVKVTIEGGEGCGALGCPYNQLNSAPPETAALPPPIHPEPDAEVERCPSCDRTTRHSECWCVRCLDCKGTGRYVGFTEAKHCPTCDGSGWM